MLLPASVVLAVTSIVGGMGGLVTVPPVAAVVHGGTSSVVTVDLRDADAVQGVDSAHGGAGARGGDAPRVALPGTGNGAADGRAAPAANGVTVSPASVLGVLGQLDPVRMSRYVQAHPGAIESVIEAPPAATAVTGYWGSLGAQARQNLVQTVPRLIGNLDGVPFSVRARANGIDLSRSMATITKRLRSHDDGKGVKLELRRRLETLKRVRKSLRTPAGEPQRSLVILDIGTQRVRAAVAIGDLESAHFVSYLVPGMFFSVDQQLVDWTDTAENLYHEQRQWLRRAFGCRSCAGAPGVATVAWIGYQTPALLNIGGTALAEEGADFLQNALSGLRALRQGDEPYLTVVAHSYGSTAALMALTRGSVEVDALAMVGSPGSAAQSAASLDVAGGNVFVGQAGLDPVVNTAFFGSDPSAVGYGARAMGVDGIIDPFGGAKLTASTGHNGYFAPGSESLRNLALIAIGQDALVTSPAGSPTENASGG